MKASLFKRNHFLFAVYIWEGGKRHALGEIMGFYKGSRWVQEKEEPQEGKTKPPGHEKSYKQRLQAQT